MKVLIVSSEVVPFAKTGGLADVAGALPKALKSLGVDVRVLMPKYKSISNEKFNLKPAHSKNHFFDVKTGVDIERAGLLEGEIPVSGKNGKESIPVYFIENEKYFGREGFYVDEKGLDYHDNGQRFSFFCKAALESLRLMAFKPDVIHCNDWQSALIPAYLKTMYADDPFLKGIKTLYTIHNLAYQGLFGQEIMDFAGLDKSLYNYNQFEFYGKMNFAKGGIVFSDAINTVSRKYAQEIMTAEFGCKLEGVLAGRKNDVYGIVNGIDYDEWDPSIDKYLAQKYNSKDLSGKAKNKQLLQKEMGLPQSDAPLFGLVGRLAAQKGMDIVSQALPGMLGSDMQLVILGKGDAMYENLAQDFSKKSPAKVKIMIGFDIGLSHRIYAGSDFFLMPSYFEPCGLGQMIAMKYGAVPVVHSTGGLSDTVTDYNQSKESGNGFSFGSYFSKAFFDAYERALALYADTEEKTALTGKIMNLSFSWEDSAQKYLELYKKIIFDTDLH